GCLARKWATAMSSDRRYFRDLCSGFIDSRPVLMPGTGSRPAGTVRVHSSTEQIAVGGHHELTRRSLTVGFEATHDRGRDPVELAADELGCPGELVGDRNYRRVQLVAGGVVLA